MEADVWVLNSCTVKNPAEDHFRNEIKAGREAGKKVVVAGCVPQGRWILFFLGTTSWEIECITNYVVH